MNLRKLNKMINKVQEAKQVGIVYHFTTIDGIKNILENPIDKGCEIFTFISRNKHFSTTRDFMLTNNPNGDFNVSTHNIRIAFDGNKLSNKYKVKPINGLIDDKDKIFGVDKNKYRVKHKSEKEEVLCPFYSKGERHPFKLKDYVLEVQIYQHNLENAEEIYDYIVEFLKDKKIKTNVTLVRKWKPYNENYLPYKESKMFYEFEL